MDGNYSLADIAAATGNGRNNDGMFGGNGAWWLIVLFLFVFCGWGNNGWGNNGNGGGYAATAATQADIQRGFDNSAVISKLDGINNGLCDGFYAVNNGMLTGFNGINTNIMQTNITMCPLVFILTCLADVVLISQWRTQSIRQFLL